MSVVPSEFKSVITCPSSAKYVRDYRDEYKNQGGTPARKKARALNNKGRKLAGGKKGDGKDAAHKNSKTPTKANTKAANLTLQPKAKNRSFPRTSTAARKKK